MPVAHPPLLPYSCDNQKCLQMSPGVRGAGAGSKSYQAWELLASHKLKKKKKINNEWGKILCFTSGLHLPIHYIWFDHRLHLRGSASQKNEAFNIYHLLAKVQKCPRRVTVLPIPPPTTHTFTETCTLPGWTEGNAHNYFHFVFHQIYGTDWSSSYRIQSNSQLIHCNSNSITIATSL